MDYSELQRVKKVINWLIYKNIAENEKEIANIIGYTKSSFSQIVNGKVPLSEKFVKKLCELDKNINYVWVLKGEEDMFFNNPNSEEITIPATVWNVIVKQSNSLEIRDKQIDKLITILEKEKILNQIENNEATAVAG